MRIGVYSTFCQEEGMLLQKYCDGSGWCIAILFTSIRVRGQCDSPEFWLSCFCPHVCFPVVTYLDIPCAISTGEVQKHQKWHMTLNWLGPTRCVVQKRSQKCLVMDSCNFESENVVNFSVAKRLCQITRKTRFKLCHQNFTTFFALKFAISKKICHLVVTLEPSCVKMRTL